MAQKNALSDLIYSIVGFAILGLIAYGVWLALPDRWTAPVWYGMEYSIDANQVHYHPKPLDCDFIHAPLGDKGCHYEKIVGAYNAAGELVAGDEAPRYGHDNTGKPIISYDNGKTWAWFLVATPVPDLTVKSVEIDWKKVSD